MDYRWASVRAGVGLPAMLKLTSEGAHFIVRKNLAGTDCGVAGERVGSAVAPRLDIAALRHFVQHVYERLRGIGVRQNGRHGADDVNIAAEWLYQQSQTGEQVMRAPEPVPAAWGSVRS